MPNKKRKAGTQFYPVVTMVGDIPIRKNNIIAFYVPQHEMIQIARLVGDSGLSVAKILSISATPCPACKGTCVIHTLADGRSLPVPRGLLTFRKTNSGSIMSKKKRKP